MWFGVVYVLMRRFRVVWRFESLVRRVHFVLVRMSYDDRCCFDGDGCCWGWWRCDDGGVVERGVLPAYYHDDAVVHTVEL